MKHKATHRNNLRRFINKLTSMWLNLKHRCQRFYRGYSWVDASEIDQWFIHTIKPMLCDMRDNHTGHPAELTAEEWNDILQEMIDLISYMDRDAIYQELYGPNGEISTEEYAYVEQFVEEKKTKFFEMFSKWFYCLWD